MRLRTLLKTWFGIIIVILVLCIIGPPVWDYYKSPVNQVSRLLAKAQTTAKDDGCFCGVRFDANSAHYFKAEYPYNEYVYYSDIIKLDFVIADSIIVYSKTGSPVLVGLDLGGKKLAATFSLSIDGRPYCISPYKEGLQEAAP